LKPATVITGRNKWVLQLEGKSGEWWW